MKPGIYKGKKVNVPFSIPINFRLKGDNTENKNSIKSILNSDKEVLFFVDGEKTSHKVIKTISPDDIESVKVIKSKEKNKKTVVEVITKKKN